MSIQVHGLAPKLSHTEIVNSIYGWTTYWFNNQQYDAWIPGITFQGGLLYPYDPQNNIPYDRELFIKITEDNLTQYQADRSPAQWVNLGPTSSYNLALYDTADPQSGTQYELFNNLQQSKIKQWINNSWRDMGSNNNGLPVGQAFINFHDDDCGKETNLYLIINSYDMSPLLAIDQGLVVKKDIAAGGMLTSNQGVLALGSGFKSIDEPPKIWLTHSQEFGSFDTLYIKQFDRTTEGNLDLGNLTAHGNVTVHGDLSAQTGITLGNGTIYWQTTTTPDVLEMNCGVIIDGALNVAGVSINGPLETTGQIMLGTSQHGVILQHVSDNWLTIQNQALTAKGGLSCYCIVTDSSSTINGQLISAGPNADLAFENRQNSSQVYLWYATNSGSHLNFNGGTDLMTIDSSGKLTIVGDMQVNGTLKINSDVIPTSGTTMSCLLGCGQSTDNVLYVEGHINPAHSNYYGIGGGNNYWAGVTANRLYAKDGTVHSFDALDDLSLVKNYKIKTDVAGIEVIDLASSLPHVLADEPDKCAEFYDISKMHGFTLGCLKALALNNDEHNIRIQTLEQEIESLKMQIDAIKNSEGAAN
jgi:hypothetical protein